MKRSIPSFLPSGSLLYLSELHGQRGGPVHHSLAGEQTVIPPRQQVLLCSVFSSLLLCPPVASDVSGILFQLTTHQELWTYIVTNLASVYIREGNRHQEVSISHAAVYYLIEW